MAGGSDQGPGGVLVNLAGWLSFAGVFATGIIGLVGGAVGIGSDPANPQFAGVAYLLLGGLAFGAVLALVLRRGPRG